MTKNKQVACFPFSLDVLLFEMYLCGCPNSNRGYRTLMLDAEPKHRELIALSSLPRIIMIARSGFGGFRRIETLYPAPPRAEARSPTR
ncbi:putative tartrate transporter [Fusarium oxysporum f. sp. albedinis]|nr:putative tartrate transporter [Fusarium oxysporum f. sp. albedinis]